ncbi:hypothetical protein ACQJBY_058744 [Aegilops geniculata]
MQEQQHEQAVLCNISRALSVQQNYSGVSDDSIFHTEVEDCSTYIRTSNNYISKMPRRQLMCQEVEVLSHT